jgi:hypothetical protein
MTGGRRIAERHRRRLFALAATVIVIAAGLLSSAREAPPPATDPPVDGRATVASRQTPIAGAGRSPRTDARRFLRGYLDHLYGRQGPGRIKSTTPELVHRLERERLRVSLAMQHRRPRVVRLGARPTTDGRALVTATVSDGGPVRYPISLLLDRDPAGGWVVVGVGED